MDKIKHHDRRLKNPPTAQFEPLTLDETRSLVSGRHVWVELNDHTMAQVKVTSVQTWKTRPANVRVRCKYGLYDHAEYWMMDGRWQREPIYREVAHG